MKCPQCGLIFQAESWQDKAKKIGSFHEEQIKLYGHAHTGRGKKKDRSTGWSLRDTADHFGLKNRQSALNFVTLYRGIKENPELEKEKTAQLALKRIRS